MLVIIKRKRDFISWRNFQTFENVAPIVQPNQAGYPNDQPSQFGGSFLDASQAAPNSFYGQSDYGQQQKSYTGNEFDDEPPLLEGKINPTTWWEKQNKTNRIDFRFSRVRDQPTAHHAEGKQQEQIL